MERKKIPIKVETDEVLWRKVGGGSLRFKGRIIKPNQTFPAKESEISAAFRDVVIRVGNVTSTEPPPEIEAVESVYTVKPRGSHGWWDVVDQNGKVLNEKALKKGIAEQFVKDLKK